MKNYSKKSTKKQTKRKPKWYARKAQDLMTGAGPRRDKKLRDAEKKALGIK
jgi:hypothetical protein